MRTISMDEGSHMLLDIEDGYSGGSMGNESHGNQLEI